MKKKIVIIFNPKNNSYWINKFLDAYEEDLFDNELEQILKNNQIDLS